ncbi:MAG: hypothetical protein M3367_03030 [Acidobacteriota bacterium]|nr:hypothetical protein [Acidobacteriota bacterium]
MPNNEPQRKIKVFKKGKWKTPEEVEEDLRRLEVSQMRLLIEKRPQELKKILSEMKENVL